MIRNLASRPSRFLRSEYAMPHVVRSCARDHVKLGRSGQAGRGKPLAVPGMQDQVAAIGVSVRKRIEKPMSSSFPTLVAEGLEFSRRLNESDIVL